MNKNNNEMKNQIIGQDIISSMEKDTPARIRIGLVRDSFVCKIYDCEYSITLHDHIESWENHVQKLKAMLNVIVAALPKIEELGKEYEQRREEKRLAYLADWKANEKEPNKKVKLTSSGKPDRKANRKEAKTPKNTTGGITDILDTENN
jgi:hypothetical protein